MANRTEVGSAAIGRRAQILEAAGNLFAEHGIHLTRIDDVAAAAGVAKGTVYWHFSSKDEIVFTLVEHFFSQVHAGLLALRDAPGGVTERLQGYLRSYAALLEQRKHLAPLTVEFYALAPRQPRIRAYLETCYAQWTTAVGELFTQANESGELHVQDVASTARSLIELIDGVVLTWTSVSAEPDLNDRMQSAWRIFIEGVRPEQAGARRVA